MSTDRRKFKILSVATKIELLHLANRHEQGLDGIKERFEVYVDLATRGEDLPVAAEDIGCKEED